MVRNSKKPAGNISILIMVCLMLCWSMASGQRNPDSGRPRGRTEKVERGLVILVQFPDVKHDVSRNTAQERFGRHLDSFVREMSYNRVSLAIDVTPKWYTMPDPIGKYKISSRNLEVDDSRIIKLIRDVLDACDRDVDFTKYDFTVIFMGAKLNEYGMIGLCGFPGMLGWSNRSILKTPGGQDVRGGVAIFSYQAHLGTLFHDVAHIIGGVEDGKRLVPCLYDHDLQAKPGPMREIFEASLINMGFWDPMSCHYIEREGPPPGISSWTRIRLNWLDPSRIKTVQPDKDEEVMLGPLEDGSSEILAVRIPLSEKTYYLIENRQPIGYDRNLPGSGVLILYADDSISECRHGQAPVRLKAADSSVPFLKGAAFDVGKKEVFRDEKKRITVRLMEKTGNKYRISITHP